MSLTTDVHINNSQLQQQSQPQYHLATNPSSSEQKKHDEQTNANDAEKPTTTTTTTVTTPTETGTETEDMSLLEGFESLDAVQKYAIGTISVILLHQYCREDMNNIAFARTHSIMVFELLNLGEGQQQALLTLDYDSEEANNIILQCMELLDERNVKIRFHILQTILVLLVTNDKGYDSRTRAFLLRLAIYFQIDWKEVMAVEMAVALALYQKQLNTLSPITYNQNNNNDNIHNNDTNDTEHIENGNPFIPETEKNASSQTQPQSRHSNPFDSADEDPNPFSSSTNEKSQVEKMERSLTTNNTTTTTSMTISTLTTTTNASEERPLPPSVDQIKSKKRKNKQKVRKAAKIGGITLVGGVLFGLTGGLIAPALLTALAGVGVTSAAGLAASGSLASGAVVGGVFGVAGGGFTLKKARNRIRTDLDEFDFERCDDPRVIEGRRKREERRKKLKERAEEETSDSIKIQADKESILAIEDKKPNGVSNGSSNQNQEQSKEQDRNDDSLDEEEGIDIKRTMETEKDLPRPSSIQQPKSNSIANNSDKGFYDDIYEDDDENFDRRSSHSSKKSSSSKSRKRSSKKKKSSSENAKVKLGSRGLESVSMLPSLHLCICVPAWLSDRNYGSSLDQFEGSLKEELPYSTHLALRWESSRLYEMGLAFAKFWASKATVTTVQQAYPHAIAAASTMAGAVAFAFSIPLTVMSCMDYIDNPWSILVSRSNGAGEELANILIEKSYGNRPVTLVGYSIGARVVFKCLECLADRNMYGIVDDCFLIGAAVTADPTKWEKLKTVVAGRLVNGYGSYDWALAYLHRGCGHGVFVAGLRKVDLSDVENLNLAYLGIEGHKELREGIDRIMKAMGVGSGFISMPPAKLIIKRRGGKSTGSCEEPGGAEWAKDPQTESGDDDDNLGDDVMNIDEHKNADGMIDTDMKTEKGTVETTAKKKKSKATWLPWSGWYGSSGSKGSSSKSKSGGGLSETSMSSSSTDTNNRKQIEHKEADTVVSDFPMQEDRNKLDYAPSMSTNSSLNPPPPVDQIEDNPQVASETLVPETTEMKEDEEVTTQGTFDWEHQRKIWEAQEKQIAEKGFAEAPEVIELRQKLEGKLMLNVSIEVAGRRLEVFLKQDGEFPMSTVEQVFTNCCDDQGGMNIKVYEHTPKQTSVSINMVKWSKKHRYPKLLEDMDVKLEGIQVKGKVRVRVSAWADSAGGVHVKAIEENYYGGEVGDGIEQCIQNDRLCSIDERMKMIEEEESKRRKEVGDNTKRIASNPVAPAGYIESSKE